MSQWYDDLTNYMDGFLLIDKPAGPTSHDMVDVVRRLRRSLPTAVYRLPRVGHAGTLDPFATGLLILGIGRATKELGKLAGLDKEYEATLRLGAVSDTYDRTGAIERLSDRAMEFPEEQIKEVLKKFTGTIQQLPPMYSAKKVKGKKLYELARRGIEIERKQVKVTIYSIDLLGLPTTDYRLPLRIRCSSGTYIRTLAQDIGRALGCGAYLEELRRTAIGPFRIEDAVPPGSLTPKNVEAYMKHTYI